MRMHSRYTRPCWIRAWNQLTGGDFSKEHARQVYDNHYAFVRDVAAQQPKDQNNSKVLDYYVKDGWKPLCDFLDLPDPGIAFPKGNEKQVFVKRFEKALLLTLLGITKRLLALLAIILIALAAFSRLTGCHVPLIGRLLFWQ